MKMQDWNGKTFKQIEARGKRECRELSPDEKINDFAHLGSNQEIERLILYNPIWQFRIDEEIRIVGILERDYIEKECLPKDERFNNDLLYVLYYDFEHTSHPDPKKEQIKEENLTCILDEKCLAYNNFLSEEED